jgi:hypothetical protein
MISIDDRKNYGLLSCDTLRSYQQISTFQRNTLPPSSELTLAGCTLRKYITWRMATHTYGRGRGDRAQPRPIGRVDSELWENSSFHDHYIQEDESRMFLENQNNSIHQ